MKSSNGNNTKRAIISFLTDDSCLTIDNILLQSFSQKIPTIAGFPRLLAMKKHAVIHIIFQIMIYVSHRLSP